VLLALLTALVLPGCSVVKLGYNNAESLSYWALDSHMDFNEVQSVTVRAELASLLAWHRANELPQYASMLDKLQRMGAGQVTPEAVCELASDVKTRFQTLLARTEGPVAAMAPTFTPAQLAHMAARFEKRNQKWHAEWLDGDASERSARRTKQLVSAAEWLYGSLNQPQRQALASSSAVTDYQAQAAYREALRRQQDTLQTLRGHSKQQRWQGQRPGPHSWSLRPLHELARCRLPALSGPHHAGNLQSLCPAAQQHHPGPAPARHGCPQRLANRCARAGRSRALSC
jgi:hypothetical protein